jgi:hypothetical protein
VNAVRKEKKRISTIMNACFIDISSRIINIKCKGLTLLLNMFAAAKAMIFLIMKTKNS